MPALCTVRYCHSLSILHCPVLGHVSVSSRPRYVRYYYYIAHCPVPLQLCALSRTEIDSGGTSVQMPPAALVPSYTVW